MIEVRTNAEAFIRALDQAWAQFDLSLSHVYAKWTQKVFKALVLGTPQWSGDLASNWRYSVGSPDYSYEMRLKNASDKLSMSQLMLGEHVKQMGDMEAVQVALDRMAAVNAPSWRDHVFFANDTPIAPKVEAQSIRIRPVNLVDGRVAMVQYTVDNAWKYQPDV